MQISKRSMITFFNVNGSLISICLIKYFIFYLYHDVNFFNKFLIMFFTYICRNYLMMCLLYNATKHKKSITMDDNNSNYQLESHLYVLSTTFFDTIINVFIYNKLISNDAYTILISLLYFIPVSLLFEIILDFFHYWSHRGLHLYYYKYIHKKHHKHVNTISINSYYFSPADLILSISIPMILTVTIIPYNLTVFEFIMISVYKQYTELAGHSGKMLSPASSFPQCIWLPRLLNIELYAEDHDLHHKLSNCNFAKRFSLWDKAFGTYKSRDKLIVNTI